MFSIKYLRRRNNAYKPFNLPALLGGPKNTAEVGTGTDTDRSSVRTLAEAGARGIGPE